MVTEQDYFNLLNKYGIGYKIEPKTIKVLCPFHEDHKHSMAIYRDNLTWKCFKRGKTAQEECIANGKMKDFRALADSLEELFQF